MKNIIQAILAGQKIVNDILALPLDTRMEFSYNDKARKGVVADHKRGVVVVLTDAGYRSFDPKKMKGLKIG